MVHLPGVLATKASVGRGDGAREAMTQAAAWEGDGQDPLEILKAKLELSDLVKQEMKSVIRAQHTKIEEYRKEVQHLKRFLSLKERAHAHEAMTREEERDRAGQQARPTEAAPEGAGAEEAGTYSKVQLHLLEDMRQEVGRSRLERGELEAQVRRLKNVVADLRARNATLKQASQRHLDMLSQLGALDGQPALLSPISRTPGALTRSTTACESALGEPAAEASAEESPARAAALSKCGTAASLLLGDDVLPEEQKGGEEEEEAEGAPPEERGSLARALGRAGTGALSSPSRGTSRATTKLPPRVAQTPRAARGSQGAGGAGGRRFTQAARDAMSLWHEESPKGLLNQLLHAAVQICENPSLALMLFVADPWLRRTMEESGGSGDDRGSGCGVKQLPHTTFYLSGKVTVHGYRRGGLRPEPPHFPDLAALPVQGRGSVLALPVQAGAGRPVLAVVQATGAAAQEPGAGGAEASTSCNALSLSDSQLIALQLLCTTVGGMLEMRRQVDSAKAVNTRALGSLDIVAKVNSAASVSEFEQIAKLRMTNFFNVFTARITFYNPASRELLLTATRAHRRGDSPKDEASPMPAIGRRNITRISTQDGIVGRCVRKRQVFHLDPLMSSPFVSEVADGVDLDGEKGLVNMLAGPMIANLSDDSSRVVGVLQLIHKRPRREADALALEQPMAGGEGDAKDKASRRANCEAFTQEDQHLFAEMLRVLGMATYRTMQVQARGDMDAPSGQRIEASIEKLLGIA